MDKEMYLVLENGEVFKGKSFGAEGASAGEVVFTTGMAGYMEVLTDPSYCGQIVVQTFPLIGNYGMISSELEGPKSYVKAYIVREWCQAPSNFKSEGTIDTFLKDQGVIGLYGIDTRRLTRILREEGTMRGAIAVSEEEAKAQLEVSGKEDPIRLTSSKTVHIEGPENADKTVAVIDYGTTDSFRSYLAQRGYKTVTLPAFTRAEDVLRLRPDGVLLSSGPGNPENYPALVAEVAKLAESGTPIFGIDLGHLLLALAKGAKVYKHKHGHRGANQPVRLLSTGRVYISSQNHSYIVDKDSLPEGAEMTFANLNDGSCEGLVYHDIPAMSVQFRPDGGEEKSDTGFLFDQFTQMMEEKKNAAE